MGQVRLLRVSRQKELLNVKRKYVAFLDAEGKRQRLGEMQARSSCLAYKEAEPYVFMRSPTRTVTLLRTRTNRVGGYVTIGCKIFEARVEGERRHYHGTILRYVRTAPGDIQWQIDQHELDEIMVIRKESALGPPQLCREIGIYVFIQSLSTCACVWPCSCTVCCEQNRFHSPVIHCRQQWLHREIAERTTSTEIVIARFSPRRFAEAFTGTP